MSSAARHSRPASRCMSSRVGSLSSTRLSIRPSIMPGLLVRMLGQVRAVGAELDVQPQAGRVEAEQLPEHALAAERIAHLVQVDQRRVGVGRGGDGRQQSRGDGRQEVPAAPRREEADLLLGQRHQVAIGLLHVAEADTCPAPRRSALRAGRDRAPGRPRPAVCRVVAEGVVQQVVEDLAVQLGLVAVVFRERPSSAELLAGRRRSPSARPACAARRGPRAAGAFAGRT